MVTASEVNKLRQMTGVAMMECKKALAETKGDLEKAVEILRKNSVAKAAKRADREAKEGTIGVYVHSNNKIAALVELNCETDFVGRNEEFVALAKDIAMQVAAMNPLYLKPEDVPVAELEKEKEIYREQLKTEHKPADVMEKIIEGKIKKYYQEVCLLKQAFVKNDKKTVEDLLLEYMAKVGEKIELGNMYRMKV